jgi:Xaa-Pro dipeptidase
MEQLAMMTTTNEVDAEIQARLRRDRLRKIQQAMERQDIGTLLLTNPVNIRYATGISVMAIWTANNLARYVLVPVRGEPVLFEYGKSLFQVHPIWPQARPARTWQFRFAQHEAAAQAKLWAEELDSLRKEWGLAGSRLAVDVMDVYGFQALANAHIPVTDADAVMEAAKLIKTPDEIDLLRLSCKVAEAALSEMEKAVKPGVTENELFATFWHKMLSLGGEYCSTRLLASGDRINPWFREAGPRAIQNGDLIGFDTDMTGPEGYLCDISRTFLCGEKTNAEQREAYRVAYDFVQGTIELCTPGRSYADLRARTPSFPEVYEKLGYSCMIHGSGFDDEPPFIPYAHDRGATMPHGEFAAGMVLSVEFYAGKPGSREGVKLEEQILITPTGPERLSTYHYDDRLLA